jgi:citrate lyase beta subunit
MALPPLADALAPALESLEQGLLRLQQVRPGLPPGRRPVHVLYGGAHLFQARTLSRIRDVAKAALDTYAPDGTTFAWALGLSLAPDMATQLRNRVLEKLSREPVEDYRIDFEDGYGVRPDAEEDGHADAVGAALADAGRQGTLPPFVGIRIKALTSVASTRRALRTLERVCLAAAPGGCPPGFAVTLPKVALPEQVSVLVQSLAAVEARSEWPEGCVALELMVETPQALISPDGVLGVARLLAAAGPRCRSLHLGPYDLSASLGITGARTTLAHPALDLARRLLVLATSGTSVSISDGPTTVLPVAPHRGENLGREQQTENRRAVHAGWRRTAEDVKRALEDGVFQGWDLHPAQLPARFGALFAFFAAELEPAGARLRSFLDRAAQANRLGVMFDDAATAQVLLNTFRRALACAAVTPAEVEHATGLSLEELAKMRVR